MTKIISISNDVYNTLTSLKGKESYSAVIRKLIERKSNKEKILAFAGKDGIDEKEIKKLKEDWEKWSEKSV